jgi:hypothetical protein
MMKLTTPALALLIALSVPALPALAQQSQEPSTVSGIIDFLVTNQAVQTGDFERDRAAAEAARDAISRALLVNLTSMPLASSSSGFLYRLNPQLGTVERATESFGSFFVERASTAGEGQAAFGLSLVTSGFDRLGDLELRDGSLITIANQFRDEAAPFDTEALTLRIRSTTLTLFGSVGVTDDFELGAALPLINLSVEGQRLNVYREEPFLQASGEASASGIGDAALRAKYTLVRGASGAFAAAAELRLPTGDADNLLGAGAAAYRFLGIGSFENGRVTVNGNGGFVLGGVSEEINVAGAVAYAVQPRVTIVGEALVRRVNDLRDLQLIGEPHPSVAGLDTLRLAPGASAVTLSRAIAGIKWNLTDTLVLGANVAFPLTRRGLTAPITPTVGLEYAFQ